MENKMQKKYKAIQTKSFKGGLADIIEGNTYQADKEQEYFINEFNETIYLPKEKFSEYFSIPKNAKQQQYNNKYAKNNVKVVYLRLFPSDIDIIEHLENIKSNEKSPTKNGQSEYIRRLIREDMKRKGE